MCSYVPTERLVDKLQVAIRAAVTLVLVDGSIGHLQQKGREPFHRLARGFVRAFLRIHLYNITFRTAHRQRALLNEFIKGRHRALAMATPRGVVHCEGRLGGVLEALNILAMAKIIEGS